jgi:transcription antitermination factor NusG
MPASIEDGTWIAVQVRSRMETLVTDGLAERGYECFLPVCSTSKRRVATCTDFRRALFPGYVFCQYLSSPQFRIIEVPGVIRLVGAAGKPTPIPDQEIEQIRRIVESGRHSEPWRFMQTGQHVVVTRGSLRGIEGLVVASRKNAKLIVSLPILRRSVRVEIDGADLVPAETQYCG